MFVSVDEIWIFFKNSFRRSGIFVVFIQIEIETEIVSVLIS